jgi:hypothetical protein
MNKTYTILNHVTNEILNITVCEILNLIKHNPTIEYSKKINNIFVKINNNIVCNTQFICHRINTVIELEQIDKNFGVEIDLHDEQTTKSIAIYHDPFTEIYEDFENYLKNYDNAILILNVKTERIEHSCIQLLNKYNVTNYFFLDSSFPMIYLLATKHNNINTAIRFSEYESIETLQLSQNLYSWVWVDCFTKFPLNSENYKIMKNLNKKICIVSPELQGHVEKIYEYRDQLLKNNIVVDAICCKHHNIINWI